jgi:hypothetical protein
MGFSDYLLLTMSHKVLPGRNVAEITALARGKIDRGRDNVHKGPSPLIHVFPFDGMVFAWGHIICGDKGRQ